MGGRIPFSDVNTAVGGISQELCACVSWIMKGVCKKRTSRNDVTPSRLQFWMEYKGPLKDSWRLRLGWRKCARLLLFERIKAHVHQFVALVVG